MPRRFSDISDFLEEASGDFLIVISALLFLISLLFMSSFYQWISGLSLFFGVVLLVSGLAVRLEGPLTLTTPSKSGFGTILICVSLVSMASAGIFVLFTTPAGIRFRNIYWKGVYSGTEVNIDVAHPLAWLVMPLATIGLCLFIAGGLLKLYDTL